MVKYCYPLGTQNYECFDGNIMDTFILGSNIYSPSKQKIRINSKELFKPAPTPTPQPN